MFNLKILSSIILTFFFLSCKHSQKDLNCADFKKGQFLFRSKSSGDLYQISRDDSIQIELNSTTGNVVKARIRWINDCEYHLRYIDDVTTRGDTLQPYVKNHTLTNRILMTKTGEINGTRYNYCIFESSMSGIKQRLRDTLFKYESVD